MANYRKIYKDYFGIKFGPEYVVHHIDANRENNDISNLLLLPKEVHAKYHLCFNTLKSCDKSFKIESQITGTISKCGNNSQYFITMLKCYLEALDECNKWYDYKMYLMGKLPNIHNIKLTQD